MKKMIEYWINPIMHLKGGGAQFELIFIATDEARMQVSILRLMHEIVISYPSRGVQKNKIWNLD